MTINRRFQNCNEVRLETIALSEGRKLTEQLEMNLIFSGNEQFGVGNKSLNLYPGNFLMLPQGISYSRTIHASEPVETLSLSYGADFVADFYRNLNQKARRLLDEPVQHPVGHKIEVPLGIYPFRDDFKYTIMNLKRAMESGLEDDLLINQYLYHCLFNYFRIFNQELVAKAQGLRFQNQTTRKEIMKRLVIAKDFMISNYNKKIRLEDVAQEACLSVNHLLRTFNQAYKTSPHQFLLKIRLERADYFLIQTDLPVSEIADLVGFECPSAFTRYFKRRYGKTPTSWRKQVF